MNVFLGLLRLCMEMSCVFCVGRICQADTDHVDIIQQWGCQPIRIQNTDPEICSQICGIQVSSVTIFLKRELCFSLRIRQEHKFRKSGWCLSSNCFHVSQPTGCSGVPALPPGWPAQRGQQGHCEAERHCGGLRPPTVSYQSGTQSVFTCTDTRLFLKSGLCSVEARIYLGVSQM